MGRKQRITPYQVLDKINGRKRITVSKLAELLECTPETIKKKLRTLREDGEKILFDSNGLTVLNDISGEKDIALFEENQNWFLKSMRGIALCAKPIRLLLPEARAYLKALPREERKLIQNIAKEATRLDRIADYINLEEELED